MLFCNQVGLINIVGCITTKNQTGHFVSCLSKRINREQNYLQNLMKLLLMQTLLTGQMQVSKHQASDAHKDAHRARFSNTEDRRTYVRHPR